MRKLIAGWLLCASAFMPARADESVATLYRYLLLGGEQSTLESFQQQLLLLHQKVEDQDHEWQARLQGQNCLLLLSRSPANAQRYASRALEHMQSLAPQATAELQQCLAMTLARQGQLQAAIDAQQLSVALALASDQYEFAAISQLTLANLYNASGQITQALELLLGLLPEIETMNSTTWLARALNEIAVAYLFLGQPEQTQTYIEQALDLPLPPFVANEVRTTYARFLIEMQAFEHSLQILQQLEQQPDDVAPNRQTTLGLLRLINFSRSGDYPAARRELQALQALLAQPMLALTLFDPNLRQQLAIEAAILDFHQGHLETAATGFQQALNNALVPGLRLQLLDFLSRTEQQLGNYQQALAHQQQFILLQQTLMSDVNLLQLNSLRAQLENELQERENRQLRLLQDSQQQKISQLEDLRRWQLFSLLLAGIAILALLLFVSVQLKQRRLLHTLALTDELTGIDNRRAIMAKAEQWLQRARQEEDLSLIIIDIDHFKLFNDQYGHETGDLVLQRVAKQLSLSLRQPDALGRTGGEEFLVVLNRVTPEQAFELAERLRQQVLSIALESFIQQPLSISLGLASWQGETDLKALMSRADKALYLAKNSGRNQCCLS